MAFGGLGLLALLAASGPVAAQAVTQTNLVSDGTVAAAFTDPHLVNAWGISFAPGGPFWVSDNGTGLTTLYDSTGRPYPGAAPLVVTIPPPVGQTGHSSPTGQVYNPTTGFAVTGFGGTSASAFLFATEDGTIAGWAPTLSQSTAIIAVDNSAGGTGAVYKGLALYTGGAKPILLAANFRSGMVEAYDDTFHLLGKFRDARLPAQASPFNVAVLNGMIFVAYAVKNAEGHDDVPGAGHGVVEQISGTGKVLHRVQVRGSLNSPWGMAIAPASFGVLSGALLVGNFGDGWINAFNLSTNAYLGPLTQNGAPLAIGGLWGLQVGNGGLGGSASKLYFTAGPNGEAGGLFGALTPAP